MIRQGKCLTFQFQNFAVSEHRSHHRIAMRKQAGKLHMRAPEARKAIRDLALEIMALDARHKFRLYDLPRHHRYPFDRIQIATALAEGIPIVGSYLLFMKHRGLQGIS